MKTPSLLTPLRICISAFILYMLYLQFAPLQKIEVDMLNQIFWLFGLPVILIAATVAACLITGLPFRVVPAFHNWWISKPFVSPAGLLTGLILLATQKNNPGFLLFAGWFITAFFLLHIYPAGMMEYIIRKLKKI